MKKLFMPYYALIVISGLLVTANTLIFKWDQIEASGAMITLMLMAAMSESVYYFFTHGTSMTLSSAIIIFSAMVLPFPSVCLTILFFTIAGRVSGVIRKEYKGVFNMKWLFNFSAYVVLAKMVHMIFSATDFRYLSEVDQIIVITIACMGHNLLNVLITYAVISFSTGTNAFKNYALSEYFIFAFYNIMFVSLLWFGYVNYSTTGILFMAVLLVPLQRSIVMQSKTEEISQMLIEDALTKARNRQSFEDVLYEKLDKKMGFSLIFLDLDKFKSINDTYGHLIGDEVLIDLVAKVKAFLRPDDMIFRYGGDEFCIITYDLGYGDILYELLRKNHEHFCLDSQHGKIKYDFTMSVIKYDGLSRDTYRSIMQRADKAMYERKQVS